MCKGQTILFLHDAGANGNRRARAVGGADAAHLSRDRGASPILPGPFQGQGRGTGRCLRRGSEDLRPGRGPGTGRLIERRYRPASSGGPVSRRF